MGFHTCEFCGGETSSGDVTLAFEGRAYVVPDMILHYVADHGYRPPFWFIDAVNDGRLVEGVPKHAEKVGYLSKGLLDAGRGGESMGGGWPGRDYFFLNLWRLMRTATNRGRRRQTRGVR